MEKNKNLFDRLTSPKECEHMADTFIYEMNERERMTGAREVISSLLRLDHDMIEKELPKPTNKSLVDPFASILRVLIKASKDKYSHNLVDMLLRNHDQIAHNNQLLWMFISLSARRRHLKTLREIVQRVDLVGDEENGIERHNRTILFLTETIDLLKSGNNRLGRRNLEIQMTGCHSSRYDGIYDFSEKKEVLTA